MIIEDYNLIITDVYSDYEEWNTPRWRQPSGARRKAPPRTARGLATKDEVTKQATNAARGKYNF